MVVAAAAEDGEDPRWRRSNTDCVSFLASRFACSKGSKCEYRSCWYWFQGNCVNPSCTFRHPPLDSLNRTKYFADPLSSHGSTSAKATSPCYFYYNSYCAKGDRCPFLHEPLACNDVVGICSEATTSNRTVKGNSAGVEMIESLKDVLVNPSEYSSDHIKGHHSKGVTESSNHEFDGAIFSASETSDDTGGHMKSPTSSDQSSEHSAMEHTEEDECRDSSPGFDVLVDDRPSNNNDLEHLLAQEQDANVLYVKYDVGDSVGYGLDYPDSECYEQGFSGFDPACYPVDCFYLDNFVGVKEHDSVTALEHMPHNGIKLAKSKVEEYGKMFFSPRKFISSTADAGFDYQYTQTGFVSKRRPESRKGAKGNNSRIKRRRGLERSIVSEEIEARSARRRQYSLMGHCSRPTVCATFRAQKKKSRRKQHHVLYGKLAERTANAKHPDY